jgi:hypothetical protein
MTACTRSTETASGASSASHQVAPAARKGSGSIPIARVEIRGGELIECGSVDEVVEIAASHPLSQIGAIEVRPLWGNS